VAFRRDTSLSSEELSQLIREWATGKRGASWTAADREAFLAKSTGAPPAESGASEADRKAFEATQAKMRAQTGRAPTWLTGERDMVLSGRARLNAKSLLGG
jgi:hypothetical protein